jgi:hypothetical protein
MSDDLTDRQVLTRLAWLFALFAVISLAAGASRMQPPGWQLRTFGDVLRLREALSMFVFAPALGLVFWLIGRTLSRGRTVVAADLLMVLAVYGVACGMGIHDPTNRMISAYSGSGALTPEVRRSLFYLDEVLGHWVFWAGFVLATWVLGLRQALAPLKERMHWPWRVGLGVVAAAFLWVMVTNLWDEYPQTRADLGVILLAALGPLAAHVAFGRNAGVLRMPLHFVIYPTYFGSVAVTLINWLIRYGRV